MAASDAGAIMNLLVKCPDACFPLVALRMILGRCAPKRKEPDNPTQHLGRNIGRLHTPTFFLLQLQGKMLGPNFLGDCRQ